MIIVRTPVRISIGGGGTDLPFYYKEKGGSLVTASIDKYIYIAVNDRFEDQIRVSYSKNEEVEEVEKIKNDRVREGLKLLGIERGVEIDTVADVPAGSGLGASGSFLVGLLNGLYSYKGKNISKKRLAEESCEIEMERLDLPSGKQDPYAAAYGGINHLKIKRDGRVIVNPLNISEETINELESNLFLFYTGILRSSTEVLSDQKKEMESKEEKMEYMSEIRKIGRRIKNALENGRPHRFGQLLNVHWNIKKRFSDKMSNPKINEWYESALENGAFGGKIIGAGGGGFFMFYCPENQEKFKETMVREGLELLPFQFEFDGTQILVRDRR